MSTISNDTSSGSRSTQGVPAFGPGESPLGLPSLSRNELLVSLFGALAEHLGRLEAECDSSEPQSTYRWKRQGCEKIAFAVGKLTEPILSGAHARALITALPDFRSSSFPFTQDEERDFDDCLMHGAMASLPPSAYPEWLRHDLALVEKAKHHHDGEMAALHRHQQHRHLPNDTSYYGRMEKASNWATAASTRPRSLESNKALATALEALAQRAPSTASADSPSRDQLLMAAGAVKGATIPIEAGEQLLEVMRGESLGIVPAAHPRLAALIDQCLEVETGAPREPLMTGGKAHAGAGGLGQPLQSSGRI